jgi:hypothetical protein
LTNEQVKEARERKKEKDSLLTPAGQKN